MTTGQLNAQLVITVAGVLEQEGANDGAAFDATFSNPHGIASDAAGNIYIADRFGHRIRKLTPDGFVSTLAGNGLPGSQNGVGQEASFNEPWGLCVDQDGNVYVADTRNNLIRKITPNGVVSTLAGSGNYGTSNGFANSATFGNPTGIEIDEDGNLFIADHLTHLIRKIDPNGFVSTLAGTPYTPGALDGAGNTAQFYRPYGLTLDREGNILVADEWNHLIRKVTPEGEVTTVAGTGIIGHTDGSGEMSTFNYPWDISVDSLNNIYVADGYNQVIRKIVPSPTAPVTYTVSTYVGTVGISGGQDGYGTSATFNGATGIVYRDNFGDFYIADAYNNLIRRVLNLQTQTVGLVVTSDGGTSVCYGEDISVQAVPNTFNSYTFYVDEEVVQTSTSPDYSLVGLSPGEHSVKVLVSDVTGSYFSNTIDIRINEATVPTITTVGPPTFYEGDSVILLANNGVEFLWSNGATSQTITVMEGGEYTVEATDENGCTGISEPLLVEVLQFSEAPVIAFLEGEEVLCYQEKAVLSSSYSTGNQWFKDGWPIADATDPTYEVTVAGVYQVQYTDSLGFNLFSNEIEIEVLPPFLEDFQADRLVIEEASSIVQFTAQTSETANFLWDFGDPASGGENTSTLAAPSHDFTSPGLYTITLVAVNNMDCLDTLQKTNYIEYRQTIPPSAGDSLVYIPNAFTPNGDDINDVFYVRGERIGELELTIYNQWGELIFSALNKEQGWDGTRSAKPVQTGTYTYLAKIRMLDGEEEVRSGHISLIR